MHPQAFEYVERATRGLTPGKVLEFGARNINGSVRDLFPHVDYTGVDITDGPGVDVVADAATWTRPGFDLVMCCEVLEHTPKGKAIIAGARKALNRGGTLIVTCATDNRAAHSAADGGPLAAGEFYRNVTPRSMRSWLTVAGFTVTDLQVHKARGDLYVTATA